MKRNKSQKSNILKLDSKLSLYVASLVSSSLLLCSCQHLVEVPPPKNILVSASVFSSNATAISAVNNIYTHISSSESFDLSLDLGLSADEFTNYTTDADYSSIYSNSLVPSNFYVYNLWNEHYQNIYYANVALEGLANSTAVAKNVKDQLVGEAKFIRALEYFYLVNVYGEIPYLITSDYHSNAMAARQAVSEVYKGIIRDLNDASNLLTKTFLAGDCVTMSQDRVRPTTWAAKALLSRVYLFMGDNNKAELEADSVMSNTNDFGLEYDLNSVFLSDSREAILQFEPPVNLTGYNTVEGAAYILGSDPYLVALSDSLLLDFETGDLRKKNWLGAYFDGTDSFFFPYKYKVAYSPSLQESTMILRLSEVLLNRAEARAKNGNLAGAIVDVNTVRARAGLPGVSALTSEDFLKKIMHERRVELFTEWGFRWLDLKRNNSLDSTMSLICPTKGAVWQPYQKYYPIPQMEIQNDPFLTQNTGY